MASCAIAGAGSAGCDDSKLVATLLNRTRMFLKWFSRRRLTQQDAHASKFSDAIIFVQCRHSDVHSALKGMLLSRSLRHRRVGLSCQEHLPQCKRVVRIAHSPVYPRLDRPAGCGSSAVVVELEETKYAGTEEDIRHQRSFENLG